jgi:hypothetical protein
VVIHRIAQENAPIYDEVWIILLVPQALQAVPLELRPNQMELGGSKK